MTKDNRKNIKLSGDTYKKLQELKASKHESYNAMIDRIHKKEFCKRNPKDKKCLRENND